MPAGITWPIQESESQLYSETQTHAYLADDYTAKTNNHSPTDDLTADHEVPAFIEHLDKLAKI
jgi:hypothetical protein